MAFKYQTRPGSFAHEWFVDGPGLKVSLKALCVKGNEWSYLSQLVIETFLSFFVAVLFG